MTCHLYPPTSDFDKNGIQALQECCAVTYPVKKILQIPRFRVRNCIRCIGGMLTAACPVWAARGSRGIFRPCVAGSRPRFWPKSMNIRLEKAWFRLIFMIWKLKIVNCVKTFASGFAISNNSLTFASVFHGIRFKVRKLFVVMTSNFFLPKSYDCHLLIFFYNRVIKK